MVCIEMGCYKVEIEFDSHCFIHDIGHVASQLGGVRFVFVKQNRNAAAHAVASYVASNGGSFY
ncbi:unnamed protein product [Malus baccata var. baccata]